MPPRMRLIRLFLARLLLRLSLGLAKIEARELDGLVVDHTSPRLGL
jgi:hypothetical protein